jgi:hypothetical protein
MHTDELVKPTGTTSGRGSNRRLGPTNTPPSNMATKPTIKPGSRGSNPNVKERSVRLKTHNNRNMNSDIPRDRGFMTKRNWQQSESEYT